jgi:hypothetical protein
VYPLLVICRFDRGCTIFMQVGPMIFNWAPYEGFNWRATLLLPQCSNFLIVRVKSLGRAGL